MEKKINIVKNYLYELIYKHKSEPNYLLPSENALCLKFKVSRITVKNALQELKAENLIFRHQGKGSFINSTAEQELSNAKKPAAKLIGLILPDLKSYFMLNLIDGAEKYLSDTEYRIVLYCTHFSQKKESKAIQELLAIGVAGILIYPVDRQTYNQELLKLVIAKFPLVLLERSLPGMKIHSVMSDHFHDVSVATQHLLTLGHKNIGIISTFPEGTSTIIERLNGYDSTLSKHNVPIHNYYKLISLVNYDEHWEDKITAYFEKNVSLSAVIIFNSDLCYKTLQVLRKMHKEVPDDISVIAYADDYSQMEEVMRTPITSIHQNTITLGKTAAKLLIKNIEEPSDRIENIKISSEFIIKTSTRSYEK